MNMTTTRATSMEVCRDKQQQQKQRSLQAREGEFRVPHQEQSNLDPYTSPQSSEEEVRYPTIGQRKPAAAKVSYALLSCLCVAVTIWFLVFAA